MESLFFPRQFKRVVPFSISIKLPFDYGTYRYTSAAKLSKQS